MLDLNVYNKLEPKKGRILITEPFLESEFFHRSVILLCEHNEDGSFGFVLNNYQDVDLTEFDDMPSFDTRLSLGGPVSSKNLYYIHTLGNQIEDSIHIFGNIYAGGDFEQLKSLMKEGKVKKSEVRFFLGYSGWVEKQLAGELKQSSWLVSEINKESDIMNTDYEGIWPDYMSSQGGKYKAFAHFPKDPALN